MMLLRHQLAEDRAVRDAALALVKTDLQLIRADLSERGIGGRLGDRIGESTLDIADEALDFADANRGKLAAAILAVIVWFARGPIFAALSGLLGSDEDEAAEEPAASPDRSSWRDHFRNQT